MNTIISNIASIIPFILLIGTVVIVHELGHYAAGRFFGAAVESFAFGFGDSVIERTDKRGTRWRLNWLPLGGFVKFVGEAQGPGDAQVVAKGPVGRPYSELAAWQRTIVSLAGPITNFVFAILIFAVLVMSFGKPEYDKVSVTQVMEEGAAQEAGFQVGDVFLMADGQNVTSPYDVKSATVYNAGEPVEFLVERDGQELLLTAVPKRQMHKDLRLGVEEEVGVIGIGMAADMSGRRRVNPIEAVAIGAEQTADIIRQTVKVLSRLVTGRDSFEKMRGPLGIGDLADKVVDSHLKNTELPFSDRLFGAFVDMSQYVALFSVSIGFFNLLPFPMLDGYSALLGVYETVVGSQLSLRAQEYLLRGGLAIIVVFFIAVTLNDLKRIGLLEVFERLLS